MPRWLASLFVLAPALMDASPAFARASTLPTTTFGWFLFCTIGLIMFIWMKFRSGE